VEVFGLGLKIKEEGAATVEASLKRLGGELAKTALTVGSITMALNKFVQETAEAQKVQAQLATALRSTGSVSGQTIESLNASAEALMQVTAFGDETIGTAQALLLTFTNIRGVFAEATRATLDLAQALGMDARSAAMMVGKALNDPIQGVTALRRAGVQLSESQKNQIALAVQSNDLFTAQRIILSELATQVGGSAEAYRNTLGGALAGLREQFGNLFEASEETGASMVRAINALTTMLGKAAPFVQGFFTLFVQGFVSVVSKIGVIALAITRFLSGIGAAAVTFLGALGTLLPGVGDNIARFIDDLNTKVAANDDYFASLQDQLKGWRAEVIEGTGAVKKLNDEMARPTIGSGVGGAGRAGPPTIAELGAQPSASVFRPETMAVAQSERFKAIAATLKQGIGPILSEADKMRVQIEDTFAASISAALTTGIVAGIENAVASGNISEGFKALSSTLLAGLGDAMVNFGLATMNFAGLMQDIITQLSSLLPGGAYVKGALLVAAGAALKGAARGMFGGGSRGGGRASSTISFGAGVSGQTTQIIFGATSATTAAGMTPRSSTNVTIIGPNDPTAQRALQELMTKANSRGRVG
jgi:uncharacterized protein with GYD domain